jgi:hypothetical protein
MNNLKVFNKLARRLSYRPQTKLVTSSFSYLSEAALSGADTYSRFPNEEEGNIYDVNWSLVEDGVVSRGKAFKNAKLQTLGTYLPKKIESGKFLLESPIYNGKYVVKEAGDSISLEDFSTLLKMKQDYLSSYKDLFVEDGAFGSFSSFRVGTRLVTDIPALSLIFRSLMIQLPQRETDYRAKFDGWNLDNRWDFKESVWNGSTYNNPEPQTVPRNGDRPIVAFVGGAGSDLAVEFAERDKVIVGANIVAGSETPVRGIIDAIGLAASVLANQRLPNIVAIPSLSITKAKDTTIIIGLNGSDDSTSNVIEKLQSTGNLYGAYHNILGADIGVSAGWNGLITSATAPSTSSTPLVVVGGETALPLVPNNLAFPANHFIFVEQGVKKSTKLTTEEATQRIVALADETKAGVIAKLLENAKISIVGSASDALSSP